MSKRAAGGASAVQSLCRMDPGGQPERMIWMCVHPADLSSADAEVLRYKTRVHSMCTAEVGEFSSTWVVPQELLLSQRNGIRAFFIGNK